MGTAVDFFEFIKSFFERQDDVARQKFQAEINKNRKKEWVWRIVAANGNKVAIGGEGYKNRNDCVRMLERAMVGFDCETFEDLTTAN